MPVIALTGGIGSGKSTVREIFEDLGALGIDADDLARKVVEPGTEGCRKVRDAFGEAYFNSLGYLDRKKLAREVFSDPAARRKLESILHPLIKKEESLLIGKALEEDPDRLIVVEVPLLAEAGCPSNYGGVVLVTAPKEIRLQRLESSGKYTRREASARIQSQSPDAVRSEIAGWTVDNSGSIEGTKKQVKRIYHEFQHK